MTSDLDGSLPDKLRYRRDFQVSANLRVAYIPWRIQNLSEDPIFQHLQFLYVAISYINLGGWGISRYWSDDKFKQFYLGPCIQLASSV